MLYIRNDVKSVECHELNKLSNESVWCEISDGKGNSVLVGVVYKSTSVDVDEVNCLLNTLKSLSGKHVLIMGDFNYPKINWSTLESDNTGAAFLEVLFDNFWTQHVSSPTREDNILDLIISSEEGMVDALTVDEHFANSDHNMVNFNFVFETVVHKFNMTRYAYNKGDYSGLSETLGSVDWDVEFSTLDVESMWCKFRDVLADSIKKFVPVVKQKKYRYPKWMTREAIRARKFKHKMWKRFQATSSYNDKIEYRRAANGATAAFRKAKQNFELKLANDVKINPKSFYSYVRSKSRTKDKVCPLRDEVGRIVVDDVEVCNVLNNYFSSVFTQENISCVANDFPVLEELFPGDRNHMLHDMCITEQIVLSKLKNLRVGKAPGIDSIVPLVLVKTAHVISAPLCVIYKESLRLGVVPSDWRKANVTAIFKQGAKDVAANYRPISLTSQVCKVMESIIRDKISEHLDRFKLINASQHGFTRGKSCLSNLLEFLHYVSTHVDSGEPVDVIYLDFQKAFDKVPHRRLLMKIEAYGITGNISRWICNWLGDREQRVVLNQSFSAWCKVISGVPQGSVLGPLLFVLFINDIDRSVLNKLSKFADDTKVYSTVSTIDHINRLQLDLRNLFDWSVEWNMLFNVSKCKVLHFGKNNVNAEYSMGGVILEAVKIEKDLGVMIQDDLKVAQQCVKAVKTANRVLGMINRTFKFKNKKIILQLYKALVRPHLEYCIQAWRPHYQKDISMLERVQTRVVNLIDSSNKCYEDKLKTVGVTTLETRRLRGDLIEVFKMFKGFDAVNVHDFFTLSVGSLRGHSCKIFKPRFKTDVGKFSFANRVVFEWNLLTEEIISCNTVEQFKCKLDRHLRLCRGFI